MTGRRFVPVSGRETRNAIAYQGMHVFQIGRIRGYRRICTRSLEEGGKLPPRLPLTFEPLHGARTRFGHQAAQALRRMMPEGRIDPSLCVSL